MNKLEVFLKVLLAINLIGGGFMAVFAGVKLMLLSLVR